MCKLISMYKISSLTHCTLHTKHLQTNHSHNTTYNTEQNVITRHNKT